MSTFYIKNFRDKILVSPLYQLSTVMTFFPAKAEVKTEGEKVKKEKQEARAWCKTYQTTSKSPILIYEGWVGHTALLMVPFSNSVLELHLVLI